MDGRISLMKPVGYGVNIKHTTFWERNGTFEDERDAYAFYYMLAKSQEVKNRNANIEIERIYVLATGDYEYETLIRLREEDN